MNFRIRKSLSSDIEILHKLEKAAFSEFQVSSKQSIVRSLNSNFQDVFVVETKNKQKTVVGSLVLFKYKKALRIYSISILPQFQNQGIGSLLLNYALDYARQNYYTKVMLEAHSKNERLIRWYEHKGFEISETISDYYTKGEDAYKMVYTSKDSILSYNTNNVIVINQPHKWAFENVNARVISVKEYLNNPIYHTNTDLRVFNLCSSYKYQSYGYYISLLATARGQRIIPSTDAIRDFKMMKVIRSVASDVEEIIDKSLVKVQENIFRFNVYFGQTDKKGFGQLAMQLYKLFEVPIFEVVFIKLDKWIIKDLKVLTFNKLPESEIPVVGAFAKKYFDRKRFNKSKLKNFKYDIAILVNPNEKNSPSSEKALQKFKTAGNKKGLYVEFITKSDFNKLNEFDALFIRETTSVNDHTYEFSRMAYAEGLVVIDDPWSILKCSNKIFQNEIFRKNKILTPQTTVFTKNLFDNKQLDIMNFPLVLKQPDSAFSLGVTKVENQIEAISAIEALFKKSDMIICQEFLYSEFDWRIGILDNKPLFACKYYMSSGHWQIYNWKEEQEADAHSGAFETIDIELVPQNVIKAALKAATLIGDGLYGVDLKMVDGKVYVVEVNDNPNIDAGIEDAVLKDKLYEQIIESLYNRIEISKNIQKIDFRLK